MPVEVVGVKDVVNGLSFFDEDTRIKVATAIDPLMRDVAETAKSYVPSNTSVLSGWAKPLESAVNYRPFPKYNASDVRAGIGYNPGKNTASKNGWQVSQYVYNVSRAGSIYETAGRLNPHGRAAFQMTPSKGASGIYTLASPKSRAFREYQSNNPFASQQFIAALEPVTKPVRIPGTRGAGGRKQQGRLIYKAWAKASPKVYEAILKAIDDSAATFTRRTEIKKVA